MINVYINNIKSFKFILNSILGYENIFKKMIIKYL